MKFEIGKIMGVLFDDGYWANVANSMMELRPTRTEVLSLNDATQMLQICCKALTDLIEDPEFSADLSNALSTRVDGDMPLISFLDEFERMERAIAMQSGVNEAAAADLGRSVRAVQRQLSDPIAASELLADTEDKIRLSQKMACKAYRGEISPLESRDNRTIWSRAWSATKGVSTISFNASVGAGAMVYLPGVGDMLVGYAAGKSIESGAGMIGDACRGYW
ncbi:hypothetical protein [Ruegeria denitrificans]|nr:hypothetical protein [Ruegeria denitrificans]